MTDKLSRREKWLYGSGDLGFSLTSTIIGAYFAIYLTDVVGVSPAIAALAIFVGGTWDYINDPIVGYISDRTRSRWGTPPSVPAVWRIAHCFGLCIAVVEAALHQPDYAGSLLLVPVRSV